MQRVKPVITIRGASLILLKLYISSLNTSGSFEAPPDIRRKPIPITKIDKTNSLYLFLLNKKFFFFINAILIFLILNISE